MPKISEAGGPTNERKVGYYDEGRSPQSPNVVSTEAQVADEQREGEDVSPGTSFSTSGDSIDKNEQSEPTSDPSSAPRTAGFSTKARQANFTAPSADTTSSRARRKGD